MGVNLSILTYIVALLPQHELNESAKALNGQLDKYGLEFSFSDNIVPHVSLYMLQINSQYLDEIVLKLSVIAKQHGVVNFSLLGWRTRNRYLAAMYTRTDMATDLQQDVVYRLNPLRSETHPDSFIGIRNANIVQRRNIERYGWRSIGDAYDPHMTVARFLQESSGASRSSYYRKDFSGSFDRIGLFEMGDNGTTRNQIAAFSLQSFK